jgi:hypothetical protein
MTRIGYHKLDNEVFVNAIFPTLAPVLSVNRLILLNTTKGYVLKTAVFLLKVIYHDLGRGIFSPAAPWQNIH